MMISSKEIWTNLLERDLQSVINNTNLIRESKKRSKSSSSKNNNSLEKDKLGRVKAFPSKKNSQLTMSQVLGN